MLVEGIRIALHNTMSIDISMGIARRRGFYVHLQTTDEEEYQAQRRTRTARLIHGNM